MGVEPILFTRLHPVAHLSTGRARGFRLVAKALRIWLIFNAIEHLQIF